MFTTQGHAEFDRFINKETLLVFTKSWEPADIEKAKAMVERGEMGLGAADAGRVADAMVRFCFEDAESVDG